ncbi:hypothetical protein IW262DRAFT_1363118 [Armillaria fumosa]|nr:hypothetical protein IW262DRAFT_1363118 [Armillaria fumosa]
MPEKDEEVQIRVNVVFGCGPCLWQIKVAQSVLAGKDVITKGTVMVILPLKQLGTQFSSWLNSKGLSAISVTAENSNKELYSVCN